MRCAHLLYGELARDPELAALARMSAAWSEQFSRREGFAPQSDQRAASRGADKQPSAADSRSCGSTA